MKINYKYFILSIAGLTLFGSLNGYCRDKPKAKPIIHERNLDSAWERIAALNELRLIQTATIPTIQPAPSIVLFWYKW